LPQPGLQTANEDSDRHIVELEASWQLGSIFVPTWNDWNPTLVQGSLYKHEWIAGQSTSLYHIFK
jgi:hypothetical protein